MKQKSGRRVAGQDSSGIGLPWGGVSVVVYH